MSKLPKPVFILGSGRSGTTVTASLLNRLPNVHIAKETGFLGLYHSRLHECDNPAFSPALIDDVNSWLSVNKWKNRASVSGFRDFCDINGIIGAEAFVHYVWQLDSPIPWHMLEFIGDNTPLYVLAIPAIQTLMPNARFIHMVRDPRDVVCSMRQMRFGADNIVVGALEWHINLGCWLMAERFVAAERRIECRYEDLCVEPETELVRLAKFLDRTPDDAATALAAHAQQIPTQETGFESLADLPHHAGLTAPLSSGKIGRYLNELSVSDIMEVEKIAQFGMLAYGYKPSQFHLHPLLKEDRRHLLFALVGDLLIRAYKRLRERIV